MRITTHGTFLVQLTRLGLMNAYLVREPDGLTLVDTGMPGSAPGILQAAQRLELPIRRVVLTHAHSDHVGSLDALHAALPDAEVLISARDARLLRGDHTLDPHEPQTPLRGGYPGVQTVPDRLLQPDDRVGSLQVVGTPGHTPGHVALLDTRDGTLIAGDAFYTVGGVAVASERRLRFPLPAMATWHAPTALTSARTLVGLNPTRLAAGHGPVVERPAAAMQQALARISG
ncbi:MBL fold metallo-hydrolase [Deinococcus sonorensis]|uniref:MBL fold metallo-hydrolase n=2 Tax=Deinococcus sonorensis TaxID=309891 RepID=A0AAU7UEX4_9DEIO